MTKDKKIPEGFYEQYKNLINDLKKIHSLKSAKNIGLKHKYKLAIGLLFIIFFTGWIFSRMKSGAKKVGEETTKGVLETLVKESGKDSRGNERLIGQILENLKKIDGPNLRDISGKLVEILTQIKEILNTDMFKEDPKENRTPKERAEHTNRIFELISHITDKLGGSDGVLDKLKYDKDSIQKLVNDIKEPIWKDVPNYLGGEKKMKIVGSGLSIPISKQITFENEYGKKRLKSKKHSKKRKRSKKRSKKYT